MEQEIWKDVPGYPDLQASSLGRIRALIIRRPSVLQGTGYPAIGKNGKTVHVHTLVAAAFHGPRPKGKEVNHKDRNRENAREDNLEYLTHEDNVRHSFQTGDRLRFSEEQMKQIEGFYYTDGLAVLEIARRMGCHRNSIRSVLATWKAPRGRRNKYQRKMTPQKKETIRKLYASGEITQRQLATMFDLDDSGISRIINAPEVEKFLEVKG